jgi:hypothetical protein
MALLAEQLRNGYKIKQSDIFALDDTFNFLLNSVGMGELSLMERDMKGKIETYKQNLNDMYKAEKNRIRYELLRRGQYYEKQFDTGVGYDYFNLIWNVNKLQNMVTRDHISVQNISVAQLIQSVDVHGLTKDGLNRARKNKNPIILAEIPYLSVCHVVVDGNHRLYTQNELGNKFIQCYILKPSQHSKAMVSSLFRYLFEFNVFAGLTLRRGNPLF